MSGDIFGCHYFAERGCYWHPKDAAMCPAMHRTVPTTKNYMTQNASSAKVEKPCSKWHLA